MAEVRGAGHTRDLLTCDPRDAGVVHEFRGEQHDLAVDAGNPFEQAPEVLGLADPERAVLALDRCQDTGVDEAVAEGRVHRPFGQVDPAVVEVHAGDGVDVERELAGEAVGTGGIEDRPGRQWEAVGQTEQVVVLLGCHAALAAAITRCRGSWTSAPDRSSRSRTASSASIATSRADVGWMS